ncbi:Melibiase family protein [Perilla frutescens var. hirtella]|uniref:Alpha-galactosidase n=1 Tax=Perilla frutescens var. hirtella TaxID=608512 RepID=A0AAD4NYI6_PERFH|nr:Melibiase family protein [Perilla frutescens var. hirtella]
MPSFNWREGQGQVLLPGQAISGEAVADAATEGGDWRSQLPPEVAAGMEVSDWRNQLQSESRTRIVNKIVETLKRHLPFSGLDGALEVERIAVRCLMRRLLMLHQRLRMLQHRLMRSFTRCAPEIEKLFESVSRSCRGPKHADESVVSGADALVTTGLAKLGYVYVNIDDCWSELARDSEGNMAPDSKAFPSGIKALADYVHSKGLKIGIYSDAGLYTCQVRPGSLKHEYDDAALFASWDIDYLKCDNCFNLGIDPQERYPPMRDALNATGRTIFYSLCEWGVNDPALWASKIGNSWRTTDDIEDTWESMTAIADINDNAAYAGPGGWNDPDMLEVGNGGMTYQEYRAHFSIWALMKTPLIIGCDVRNMTTETHEILTNEEVIAVNQDPLGVQGRKVYTYGPDGCYQRSVIALWNRCSKAATITAKWDAVGLEPSASFSVRDVWKHEYVSLSSTTSFSVQVEGHACEMYILASATAASAT